ncbi:MAG: hypothetical protein NTW19_13655 [Planctomycetota bacterium]|nr:hypothetical protein [Planctomycetota bacterium]
MSDLILRSPIFSRAGLLRMGVRVVCIAAFLALAGCQSQACCSAARDAAFANPGPPTGSLALDSPSLARLNAESAAGPRSGELPWYTYRRDVSDPVAYDGSRSAVFEQSVTYTSDHQTQSNGHVHDYSRTSTYRVQVSQTVR